VKGAIVVSTFVSVVSHIEKTERKRVINIHK
jgi:hypothetical protein